MAEGDASSGLSKSRIVLGDLTNRIEKRRNFGRKKDGVGGFGLNGEQVFKRFRISPRPCTGINALKGTIISGISKLTSENRDRNALGSGFDSAVSKNTIDAIIDCDSGHIPKEESVLTSDSEVYCETNDRTNKIDPDLINDVEGQAVTSVSSEVYGCGKLDSLRDNTFDAAKVVNEKSPSQKHFVGDSASAHGAICGDGGSKSAMGNSIVSYEQNDLNLLNLSMVDTVQTTTNEAIAEFGDNFPADSNARMVNKSSGDGKSADINISSESTQEGSHLYHNDLDNHKAENLILSQSGSIDCTVLPDSQESAAMGIDRPARLNKQGECTYVGGGNDSIKSCSCSFCSKAALILLDLHQQDIKARVTAIKKSQREASMFADRSLWSKSKIADKHNYQSINRVSKMESHLMYQWRSLFQHSADIWEHEGKELEASLLPLADLRKKCQKDLELLCPMPSEKL